MPAESETVDREQLVARLKTIQDRIDDLQCEYVGRFHERVLALAPEGHLDLTRLDEDDARELWLLADVIAFDNGMKWRDEPPE